MIAELLFSGRELELNLYADAELSRRLWQEVADRDLSIDRITHLLYGCWFHDDDQAMVDADEQFVVA